MPARCEPLQAHCPGHQPGYVAGNADTVQRLAALPCRVYSLDGTNSNFSETLFIVRELITGLVLGMAILTEHDQDTIRCIPGRDFHTLWAARIFSWGMASGASLQTTREFYADIPFAYCQQHFLRNLGKVLDGKMSRRT